MAIDITTNFPRVNQLNVRSVMFTVQAKLQTDPDFAAKLKQDPVGVLQQFGIPRTVAVAIIADDVGIAIRPPGGDAALTSCCCSACSLSSQVEFDQAVLPASDDLQAWQGMLKRRAQPRIRIDPAEINIGRNR